ncbi:MAG TPA: NF038122 family metalloprotease [Caulobacteraceae bacterium]
MQDLLFDNPPFHFDSPVHFGLALGDEYMLSDNGHLVEVANLFSGTGVAGHAGGGGGGSPAATLVGSANGLEFDLIWDSSVTSAKNWKDIESSVIQAAELFTGVFTNHAVLNIEVGFGEVGGRALEAGALGESDSLGYLVPNTGADAGLVGAVLGAADAGLVAAGQMATGAANALDGVANNFFITAAEAKALGLVDPTAGLDGAIGFSNTALIAFGHTAGGHHYDAVAIAAHELSEVMGRVGFGGATLIDQAGDVFSKVYTPLDIFRYAQPGVPDLTSAAGFFSLDFGVTDLLPFNDGGNGGDAADWGTSPLTKGDAFDAFAATGKAAVSSVDMLALEALGYQR